MDEEQSTPAAIPAPIRRSTVILAARIFLVVFIADSLYAALIAALSLGYVPSDWSSGYSIFLWVAHTAKSLAISYLILTLVIKWISTVYYVSEEHLIRQRGVMNVKEHVFQLKDIESVSFYQPWLGRLFNFGNVLITFVVAREREEVELYAITNPQKYERFFSRYV